MKPKKGAEVGQVSYDTVAIVEGRVYSMRGKKNDQHNKQESKKLTRKMTTAPIGGPTRNSGVINLARRADVLTKKK